MQEIVGAIAGAAGIIEKAGIIGVMLFVMAFLMWERVRLVKELSRMYRQRDRWRLAFVKCKAALDNANPPIKIDLSDLSDLVGEESK